MKNTFRSLCLNLGFGMLLCSVIAGNTYSQFFDLPKGENIVSTATNRPGLTPMTCLATEHSIYIIKPSQLTPERIRGSDKKIVDVALKEDFRNAWFRGYTQVQILVLFDDGSIESILVNKKDIHKVEVYPQPTTGSESFRKAVGDDIYVLGSSNVYVFRNNGSISQVDTAGFNGAVAKDIAMDSTQNVYAITTKGIFSQALTSNAWIKMNLASAGTMNSIFVDRKNLIHLSAGSELFETTDRIIWTLASTGITQPVLKWGDDAYGDLFAVTNTNTLYRKQGGGAWTEITAGLNTAAHMPTDGSSTLVINGISGDSVIYAATNFGLYSSNDHGTTWTELNSSIKAERSFGLEIHSGNTAVVSTNLGVFQTNSIGSGWQKTFPVTGFRSGVLLTQSGSNFYAYSSSGSANKFVYKSGDEGLTWTSDTLGISSIDFGGFAVDNSGTQHAYSSHYGSSFTGYLYEKKSGESWKADTNGFTPKNYSYGTAIAFDGTNKIYVSGVFPGGARVMTKTLPGGAWTPDTIGLPQTVNRFTRFAASGNGKMYGTSGSTIFVSSGGSWNAVPPSKATGSITAMCTDASGTLFTGWQSYTGTGNGIYYTKDDGANWTFAGYDGTDIFSLTSQGNDVYAATDHGIYKLNASAQATYKLSVAPAEVSFGSVRIGDSVGAEVTLFNSGTREAALSHQITGDPDFSGFIGDLSPMAAFDSQKVFVQFKPVSAGAHTATLSISSTGDPSSPYSVPLTGNGAASGVDAENVSSPSIQIYPNPSSGEISITFPGERPVNIKITNQLGSVVKQATLAKAQPLHLRLASGSYLLEASGITDSGKAFTSIQPFLIEK